MMQKILFCTSILFISCKNNITTHSADNYAGDTIITTHKTPVYLTFKKSIDSIRIHFKKFYVQNGNPLSKSDSIKSVLIDIINNKMPAYWIGTKYDFNGTTTIPQQGGIACGYFVTGLLKDAGVKLNRRALSICPSLTMMKGLTSGREIKNLSALDYEKFAGWIDTYGKSVFIIGLDFHTGFIVNDGKDSWFIHSNYINKQGVVKEKIRQSIALKSSKTRYLTSLTDSEIFLRNWLLN